MSDFTNMTKAQFTNLLMMHLDTLTVSELRDVNANVVNLVNRKMRNLSAEAGASLRIGQVVKFDGKSRGIKTIKIQKFNRAGTCVIGLECNEKGVVLNDHFKWTVANSLCKAI